MRERMLHFFLNRLCSSMRIYFLRFWISHDNCMSFPNRIECCIQKEFSWLNCIRLRLIQASLRQPTMKRAGGAARFAEKNTTRTVIKFLKRVEIFFVATEGYLARRKSGEIPLPTGWPKKKIYSIKIFFHSKWILTEAKKYILVLWPFSQIIMEHPRFRSDCYLLQASEDQEHFDSAYFVPEDIYETYREKI
jgi:hypothetical protein